MFDTETQKLWDGAMYEAARYDWAPVALELNPNHAEARAAAEKRAAILDTLREQLIKRGYN